MSLTLISEDKGVFVSLYNESYTQYARLTQGASPFSFNAIILVVAVAVVARLALVSPRPSKKSNPVAVSNKDRKLGTWTPEVYEAPKPEPFRNWDFHKTKPLPYRAFKHKYNITMGIRNMDWNSWFELDSEWSKFHQEKLDRIAEKGSELYETGDRGRDGAYELLDELKKFLPERYPTLFQATRVGLDNLQTGEKFDFTPCDFASTPGAEDPMLIASKLLQDDLAVMVENEDGNYSMEAGAIILAGFWRFRDKYKLQLNEIHTSGDVPQYNEKLRAGMTRFFTRLTCDKPVVRNNYFIQNDDKLGWSPSIGDESTPEVGWYTAETAVTPEQLYFRSERQSLRRLPKTGVVIFTVRTYFLPITELCLEPYIPRRLLDGISSWTGDVEEYKGYSKYADVLLPYLQKMAEKQEAEGLNLEEEPSVFPF